MSDTKTKPEQDENILNSTWDLRLVEEAFARCTEIAGGDPRLGAVLTMAWATLYARPD